jgi:hypothetical protein
MTVHDGVEGVLALEVQFRLREPAGRVVEGTGHEVGVAERQRGVPRRFVIAGSHRVAHGLSHVLVERGPLLTGVTGDELIRDEREHVALIAAGSAGGCGAVDRSAPSTADDVVMDRVTATKHHFRVGNRMCSPRSPSSERYRSVLRGPTCALRCCVTLHRRGTCQVRVIS